MPADQTSKQKVAQRIKDASNILVTVSRDPSVDELSAALAMSLILDKLGKASTAVFSGKIPSAIDFLEPGKTFDTNVDGLRDFIIALDKSKADRLRYKVEGDVVRVFITPYRTTITEDDLDFSQGDFNVDLVVAFGVEKNDDLDAAIAAHGRIFHDAAIVTVNAGTEGSLGEINWSDEAASSLSEMLMGLMESLKADLLDEPIATALLTGLVSATDRFRNEKTSPKVMTMSAQLMAAGANQQLIADNLESAVSVDMETEEPAQEESDSENKSGNAGEMIIERDEGEAAPASKDGDRLDEIASSVAAEKSADAIAAVNKELGEIAPESTNPAVSAAKISSWRDAPVPSTGGTLNATTEEAAELAREVEERDKNRVLLSHDGNSSSLGAQSAEPTPPVINSVGLDPVEPPAVDIFAAKPTASEPVVAGVAETNIPGPAPMSEGVNPTVEDLRQQTESQVAPQALPDVQLAYETTPLPSQQQPASSELDSARAAIDAALGGSNPAETAPSEPAPLEPQPLAPGYAMPTAPTQQPAPVADASPQGASSTLPPLPPMPDFSTLPPLPGENQTGESPAAQPPIPSFGLPTEENNPNASVFPMTSTPPNDPTQFQLPSQ